jgi:hypothetical protein
MSNERNKVLTPNARVMDAKTTCPLLGPAHPRGAAGANMAGQYSCTSLISRAFPDLWPRGPEISFCHIIDHCRTILYYFTAYCRLFTLLFRPGGLTGSQTLTARDPDSERRSNTSSPVSLSLSLTPTLCQPTQDAFVS